MLFNGEVSLSFDEETISKQQATVLRTFHNLSRTGKSHDCALTRLQSTSLGAISASASSFDTGSWLKKWTEGKEAFLTQTAEAPGHIVTGAHDLSSGLHAPPLLDSVAILVKIPVVIGCYLGGDTPCTANYYLQDPAELSSTMFNSSARHHMSFRTTNSAVLPQKPHSTFQPMPVAL